MQFDVYKNQNPASRERFPFVLDVQADLLDGLETRVVVPLAPRDFFEGKTLTRLMPVVEIQGQEYFAITPQISGIAKRELGRCVANLASARADFVSALDLLLTGC